MYQECDLTNVKKKKKKHKRGERGSTDEELTTSKRANMAATADQQGMSKETEILEEPSNLELREMLVDIQITVNNILLKIA